MSVRRQVGSMTETVVERMPAPDPTAAAFFDVDNTMIMGASIFHLARGLVERKFFRTADLLGFAWKQVKFRVLGREDHQGIEDSREQLLSFVAGRRTDELAALCEEIFDSRIASRVWPGTRSLAQLHLAAGQRVWLVTAAPVELAEIIARRLGLTGALGTVGERENGVYTGRLVGGLMHGQAKADALRVLAEREGLNLANCVAYSDSHNDLPMLSAVGTAIAVNPDSGLREIARTRGWEIRDFRTGRKAIKIGLPTILATCALAAAITAVVAGRRRI